MTMPTDDNNEMPLIELYDFAPNPDAPADAPSDDFIALDMGNDAPVAEVVTPVEVAPVAEVAPTVTPEAPTVDFSFAGPITGDAGRFGSIRRDGFVAPTSNDRTFDASPLTSAEIAERDANRAATLARQAARAAVVAPRPGGNEDAPLIEGFDGSIVVESLTEKLHGLSLHFGPCQIPRHTIARDVVIDLLTTNGFADCAPAIRSGNAQLRKVMNSLNSKLERDAREDDLRLRTWNVTERDCKRQGMEWPVNLDSRWIVGLLSSTADLGSMGAKELVVSLVKVPQDDGTATYEVQFTGGTWQMKRAVTERFNALYGTSALNVTDLIAWYQSTLIEKFGAIRQGFKLLIVGNDANQENMARAERFMQILQGEDIYGPSPIMGRRLDCDKVTSRTGATWEAFCRNVGAGMVEDIRALGTEFAVALKQAQDRARDRESAKADATPESIELKVRRAVIGSDREKNAASSLLARLTAFAGRARDSVSLIGRAHALAAINACEALRVAWVDKCHADSTASMMAEIELD